MRYAGLLTVGLLLIAGGAQADGRVTVSFVHPEVFTDAGPYAGSGQNPEKPALAEIRQQFERLAARYLKPGQTLAIEVTDVHLAGQTEPWRRDAYEVRVMRDVYPPRIAMGYQLSDGGRAVRAAQEALVDIDYLANAGARRQQDPLRFEKAMLDDWFRRFARQAS